MPRTGSTGITAPASPLRHHRSGITAPASPLRHHRSGITAPASPCDSEPMEAAWIGVKLWAMAVNECQSPDPSAIARSMRNQRMLTAEGEFRIDAGSQHLFKTPRIGKIQADGQFEIVWTAEAPVDPRPYPKSRTSAEWRALLSDLYNGWGEQWSAPK